MLVWDKWGPWRGSGWFAGTVESVREGQEGLASPGRMVAARFS
jgi:hypothetical protein